MLSWLLLVVFLGGCVVLIWLARRIEPHWVSKDGRRFTCRVARLTPGASDVGSWTEAKVVVTGDTNRVTVALKPSLLRRTSRYDSIGVMRVEGRAQSDRAGLIVYLLRGETDMALRVPRRSRAVRTLDELAAMST